MMSATDSHDFLTSLCDGVHSALCEAEAEYKREIDGDGSFFELLLTRHDKVRVELRKENVSHHEPHIHVTHSDKIDASISIRTFRVLAGSIDVRTHKHLKRILVPAQEKLLLIWEQLNEKDNAIAAEKMISNLF